MKNEGVDSDLSDTEIIEETAALGLIAWQTVRDDVVLVCVLEV